ncbi:alpha/beta-hydrolase [Melanomma pulvis-pyrius CBS 109.77]|uniref:Alpha/beta-hydrolase n=1 Tax=Melanomma pulvis-pyrius CBS 109.77 TaxID=1314802 RepID=A0A6A6XJF2_9PLEO|nr:alpha/beta-hydrolase [Melanomma pulvis-pyrius CBS 109.77]
MALPFLLAKLSLLPRVFQPTYDALFSTLPFWQRWRLLLLQPINILVSILLSPSWLFNNRYSVLYIPTRSGRKRCLIYQPPGSSSRLLDERQGEGNKLKPLHINIHGGGFIGGIAEQDSRWCSYLSNRTDAVVVSLTYRIAPRHTFPAAHEDVDDLVEWVLDHAMDVFGADKNLMTLGGASAGGNLALSAAIGLYRKNKYTETRGVNVGGSGMKTERVEAKAFLGFCVPLDFRIKPEEKPKPPHFPTRDPTAFLLPLFDAYAGLSRAENLANPRLNLIVADKATLPGEVLFVVAGIDILLHEQLTFVQRVEAELEREGNTGQRIEALVVEKGFHGWLELPSYILEEERMRAFDAAVDFIRNLHGRYGWEYDDNSR